MPKYHNDPVMQKRIEDALAISRKLSKIVRARIERQWKNPPKPGQKPLPFVKK